MITEQELKGIYECLNRESKRIVINELSNKFKLSQSTIQSHWLSRWNIPKGIYQKQTKQDIKEIFINQLNKQNENTL